MPYKVILTHMDSSPQSIMRSTLSCQIARQHGAHLIGLAPTVVTGSQGIDTAKRQHQDDQLIQQNLIRFEQQCSTHGVQSFESRRVANTPLEALLWHARFADLIVTGHSPGGQADADTNQSISEEVLLRSSRPTLVVPSINPNIEAADLSNAVIAWDGSQAAAIAVSGAMPLLESANNVFVAIVHDPGIEGADELVAGSEVCLYLSRHGITAHLVPLEREHTVAGTLLEYIRQTQPGVLVMGGYGHSRLRERLLGGTTRSVLSELSTPALMTH